ncbi:hypothetical protein [Nocardioides sp. zg-1228]|uniref:hypothetical protein n=1 Tax=Nocardioides sp. zg-1228 TaxID=2763008 RepID=UPI001642DC18|nr:hypothetical protein [Nocardioides sp. zg-1228]MBC2933040.1 hypothetical protein [Nocardioides sp. zg-1228]QSF56766.1 hypothetical protein JX575_14315 [Nocardioides sp. zg-1228]
MPTNSFRLFVVSLHDDRIGDRQPFRAAQERPTKEEIPEDERKGRTKYKMVTPDKVDYLQVAMDEVNDHPQDKAFVFGKKTSDEGDDLEDGSEAATVVGHALRWTQATGMSTLRLWFEAGPTSEDGVVVDLSGETSDLELKGRATLHPYRAVLVAPDDDDARFALLAVEKRGRSCPKDQVIRALHETGGSAWRLRVIAGAAERASVLEYIDRSGVRAVTFTEFGYKKDGQKAPPTLKKLRVAEIDDGFVEEIKDTVREWVMSTWSGGGAAAAGNLKSVIITEEVDIAFNDVTVEFDDDQLQRSYKPTSDFDQFSYWLGKDVVADTAFFSKAEKAAADLLPELPGVIDDGE